MTLLMWICAHARADWTEHLVESRFLSTPDFPLAGIDVRVEVEGLGPLWLQIDTGVSEAARLYGRSLPWSPPEERFVAAGSIGAHRFSGEPALVLPDLGGPGGRAGVVGVAAFDGSWLVLDLAERLGRGPEAGPEHEHRRRQRVGAHQDLRRAGVLGAPGVRGAGGRAGPDPRAAGRVGPCAP